MIEMLPQCEGMKKIFQEITSWENGSTKITRTFAVEKSGPMGETGLRRSTVNAQKCGIMGGHSVGQQSV